MFQDGKRFAWFQKLMRKKFLVKMILMTVFIAVIPNLLSNVVAYYQVSATFKEETGENKLQYLNQTLNAIEIVLKRVEQNSNLLVLNQSFLKFEQFPNGSYYESLQGELRKEDLPSLYDYLTAKTNAILTINSFRLSNDFVHSVYYYDSGKQLVVTSESDGSNRQFPFDSFYDTDWHPYFERSNTNSVITDTRITKQYDGTDKSLLTILYRTKDRNAIVVNLVASIIYDEIINKLNTEDDVFVVSQEGKILFRGKPDSRYEEIERQVPKGDAMAARSGSFVMEMDGSKQLITHAQSPYLGWTFVNVSDMEVLLESVSSIKRTILLSMFVLILLTIALAYLSSRSLYKPISRLKALAGGDSDRKSEQTDEIGTIGSFMLSAVSERDSLKERLEESLPVHREQFKSALLYRHTLTLEEIERKKTQLGIDIDSRDLVVLALSLDADAQNCRDSLRGTGDTRSYELAKLRMIDALERSSILRTKHYIVEAERDIVAIVINCGGMDRQQVFMQGQRLLDEMNGKLPCACTVGVGSICGSIADLPQAYEDAKVALKYRIVYGSGQVIAIDDIRIDDGGGFVYPSQREDQLLGHLRTARTQEALQAFADFVSDIDAHKHKLHYSQIQPMFIQLLTGIIQACRQLGANMSAVLGGDTDPYRQLLDQDSLDRIERWFRRVIELTTAHLEREMNAKGNQHISKIISILESDYSQDISLNTVAEELSMNPAYISRLFKQITGQSFVDYLKRIRIEKSKTLLTRGDLKISEVGKQVGYDNAYYFIKVFKDMIGITPGEYKKLYGSG